MEQKPKGNMLFTDRSHVCLWWIDERRKVGRRQNEDMEEEGVQVTEAFRGGGLMVWAGISINGKSKLVVIRGGLDANCYIITTFYNPMLFLMLLELGETFS